MAPHRGAMVSATLKLPKSNKPDAETAHDEIKIAARKRTKQNSVSQKPKPSGKFKVTSRVDSSEGRARKPDKRQKPGFKAKVKYETKPFTVKTKKEDRAAAKEKFVKRKMAKTNYETIVEMKRIWEELRRHKLPADKRRDLCERLRSLIGGKEKEFSKAHDTCRVVQCLYKYGDESQRTALFESLKETVVDMAKSKYSIYLVKKMVKVGTKSQKALIIDAFMREARKLLKHRIAGHMVEYIYNMYASASQRAVYSRQFYGPAFALTSSRSEQGAEPAAARQLGALLVAEPHRREAVARHLREVLETMVQKEALAYTLVHELFLDYFQHATVGSDAERQAMAEVLQEHVPHLVHTREGAKVGAYCIWFGTTKVRKAIVKSLKPHVEKMCVEEFSPLVLFAIFDSVDDTQLVQKVVLQAVSRSVGDLLANQYGRKVLHYLLKPRDPSHFPREVADFLAQGDANPVSKKERSRRHGELLAFVSPALLQYVNENMAALVADNASLLVVENVLLHAVGDTSPIVSSFVHTMALPFTANSGHLVENTACHIVMKKLISDDSRKLSAGASRTEVFASVFLSTISVDVLRSFINCNRGCFIFLSMLKMEDGEISLKLKEFLKPIVKSLKAKTFLGAKLLLQQLKV